MDEPVAASLPLVSGLRAPFSDLVGDTLSPAELTAQNMTRQALAGPHVGRARPINLLQ